MGQINCHCQTSQNQILQSQSLRKQPTMALPVGKRRVKSRVNSIISPRQIEAFTNSETMNISTNNNKHKKAQSSLDLKKWSEKMTNNFDKNREKVLKNLKQRYKSNLISVQLQFFHQGISHKIQLANEQKTLGLIYSPRDQSEEFNFQKFQNSNYYNLVIKTQVEHQAFSICTKYSQYQNSYRLFMKDNRLGLGVFKYIKQNQSILMDVSGSTQSEQDLFQNKTQPQQIQNNNWNQQILLDVAVGQFMIIKLFNEEPKSEHFKSKTNYFVKCFLITQNKPIAAQKATKSLPSLFFMNPLAPTSTPKINQSPNKSETKQSMWLIREGEQKSILSRVLIKVPNKKQKQKGIIIKSVHSQGFYKLLSGYEQINDGVKLRCGSKMYGIELDGSDCGLKCKMGKIQR